MLSVSEKEADIFVPYEFITKENFPLRAETEKMLNHRDYVFQKNSVRFIYASNYR